MTVNAKKSGSMVFSGAISCKAALEGSRIEPLCLMVDPKKRSKDTAYIIALAKQRGVRVEKTEKTVLDTYGKGHGGILLEGRPLPLPSLKEQKAQGMMVYLDGVEDPYNMGSCIRTLYAAGAQTIFLPVRDWDSAWPVLMKASAGAWSKANIVLTREDALLDWCGKHEVPIVSAYRGGNAASLASFAWPETVLMVIGGALRGISAAILEQSRNFVYIPYGRDFRNALDTPSASAVFAFSYTFQHPFQPQAPAKQPEAEQSLQ